MESIILSKKEIQKIIKQYDKVQKELWILRNLIRATRCAN